MKDYDLKEIQKQEDEKTKKKVQMEIINQQFKDMKIKRIKEHQDQIVEGEIIKLQAQDALEKEKQKRRGA